MKKILILVSVICMSMVMLAACGGSGSGGAASVPENPGDVYRVVVTDESGEAVQGVTVQFCSETMCLKGETDASGIATFENQEEGAYTVHVIGVPEGFAEDDTEYPAPEKYGDVTITLKAAQ